MKKIFSILLLAVLFSCIKDNGALSENDLKINQNMVVKSGSKKAYVDLLLHYSNAKDNAHTLLPYTVIMATKYNDPDAMLELYKDLIKLNNNGLFKDSLIVNLKKQDAEYAISLLKRGAVMNDIDCKVFLSKHYSKGWGIEQNMQKADSLTRTIK